MEILAAINHEFAALRAAGMLDRAFEAWRTRWDQLRDLEELDALIGCCRGPKVGTRRQKDRIHVALCLQGPSSQRDPLAGVALCWLFIPGLAAVRRDLVPGRGADQEDVTADLIAGFLDAASRVHESSTHVARHLLRGARRQALRGLRVRSPAVIQVDRAPDNRAAPEMWIEDRIRLAIDAGILGRAQAEFLLASRSSIALLAARHGMSLAAAQQARHRARQRLRAWLAAS